MAETITSRPDDDATRPLPPPTEDGTSVSEAEALVDDQQDRAEAAQVMRDMEHLRADR